MATKNAKAGNEVDTRAGIKWIMLIYFCSGTCSLIDEVVWVRLLKLTIGNTVYASSIVVSVFMGGLALGALIMSRYADKVKRRLRLYAILEVCAALSALALPFLLRFADGPYRWFYATFEPSMSMLLFVQVVFSAIILLVPTMIMGSTLPLLGRYVTQLQDRIGRRVGILYALNTLGATFGTFIAGFFLVRLFGVMGALYIAAFINLMVAFGGWVLSLSYDDSDSLTEEAPVPEERSSVVPSSKTKQTYILLAAFFTSGMISIGYELLWMRSIVLLLGGFTYVFSAVLSTYLLGNVTGVWIGSRLARKLKRPAVGFGVSLAVLGLLGIFYLPWLSAWSKNLSPSIVPVISGFMVKFYGLLGQKGVWAIFNSFFLFFIPSVMMGIGFPLALQAWGSMQHEVGQTTGTVYGANTIGAVLGGVVTGFIMIPLFGVQLSMTLLGLVGIWFGFVLIQFFIGDVKPQLRYGIIVVPAVCSLLALLVPGDMFVRDIVSQAAGSVTLTVKEGVTTTVAVKRFDDGSLQLSSDGARIAGDDLHRSAQQTLGHLGILLNKGARDVLSIGFGSGETTLCISQHNLDRIDCVEIASELVDVALDYFSHINLAEQLDQKVNMYYMDAKNYLHLTPKTYDIIINDADVPAYSGSAPMFAKEHFESARNHLNDKGMFITKLPLIDITRENFDSIMGTFLDVFPHVTVWYPTTKPYIFFYLIGSVQEQKYSPAHIDRELAKANIKQSVDYINFDNSFDVLNCYFGDEKDIRRYLKDFNVNSDFTPFVEFNADRNYGEVMNELFPIFVKTIRLGTIQRHLDWSGISSEAQKKWEERNRTYYDVSTFLLQSQGGQHIMNRLILSYKGLKLMPGYDPLLELEDECLTFIKKPLENGQIDAATMLTSLNALLDANPDFGAAWLVKSWALVQTNQMDSAISAARTAINFSPYNAHIQNNLGELLMKSGQTDSAIVHYTEAVNLITDDADLRYNFGIALLQKGRLDEAVIQLRETLNIRPEYSKDNVPVYMLIGNIFDRQGKKKEAAEQFRKAREIDPQAQA